MEVKLYLADARELRAHQTRSLSLLTASRRAEAESFTEEQDRLLHCAAGLLLRYALNITDDGQLLFGEYGKPELCGGNPQFSLSHAGHYAALAVSDRPVGVDIEPHIRPDILPRKMLTEEEMNWLNAHSGAEDFCLLWTRLESALKAEGCGLALEKRTLSLLEEGEPWHWNTMLHDGHTVTCAAASPFQVDVTVIPASQLLK